MLLRLDPLNEIRLSTIFAKIFQFDKSSGFATYYMKRRKDGKEEYNKDVRRHRHFSIFLDTVVGLVIQNKKYKIQYNYYGKKKWQNI